MEYENIIILNPKSALHLWFALSTDKRTTTTKYVLATTHLDLFRKDVPKQRK